MKKSFLLILIYFLMSAPIYAAETDDPAVLYNKGIDYYEQDKIEESIATFKKAIALDPEFYEAYYNLARIQEAAGKTQDAVNSYDTLLKIKPDDYESAYQYSQLLYKNGYLSKALLPLQNIPSTSEYYSKAKDLETKIAKRQNELASEAQIKAQQNLKTSVVGNIPAPSGLVIDSSKNMYVASFSESKIIKISPDGQNKIVFADKTRGLDGPIGLAIDSHDNIYVANYNKGNVLVLNSKGAGKVLMYAKKPYCISVDENKAKLYLTEQQNSSVVSFDISDILNSTPAAIPPKSEVPKSINIPVSDKNPIGTPSLTESNFTKNNPQSSITAPIMVPTENLFSY